MMAHTVTEIETIDTVTVPPATLVAWREAMGFSRKDAAEALGCSRQSIQNWEDGTNKCPRYIGLAMAALAMGMHPFGITDDKDSK